MPLDTTPIVDWLTSSGLRILGVAVGSLLLRKFIFIAIGRMERLVDDEDPTHLTEREKRARTLGSMLRKLTTAVVLSVAALTILDVLGVDTRAILTAAGIGGLAIGFGAQSLVRDLISGFFLLLENHIRVGDVVEINGVGGQVEDITLRSTVLRGLDGTVHVFPNGNIQSLSNRTKDFSRYVIDVGVAYKEDVDRVMAVLKDVGDGLAVDPSYQPLIKEPLQVLGVDDFAESAVIIKVAITTLPLKQWEVGRELRRRIKKRFDAEGIEIPFPHLSLYWGEASKPFNLHVAGPAGGGTAAAADRAQAGTG